MRCAMMFNVDSASRIAHAELRLMRLIIAMRRLPPLILAIDWLVRVEGWCDARYDCKRLCSAVAASSADFLTQREATLLSTRTTMMASKVTTNA